MPGMHAGFKSDVSLSSLPASVFTPYFLRNKANHKGFDKPSHQTAQSPDAQEKNANETLDQRTSMPAFFFSWMYC